VLLASIATLVAILMFSHVGDTRWLEGSLMSAGSVLGGYLGAPGCRPICSPSCGPSARSRR
jgi:uncharacterized membrane protein YfcA